MNNRRVPFKEYEKEFEDYFKTEKRGLTHFYKVGFKQECGRDLFLNRVAELANSLQSFMWDFTVKATSTLRKITYDNKRIFKKNLKAVSFPKTCFKQLCFKEIGFYPESLFRGDVIKILNVYLEELYPNIDEIDVYKNPIPYPYVYMNFNCLALVYKMDEKFDLLKIGEDRKMSPLDFFDYVMNYICCYNEEHGTRYTLESNSFSNRYSFLRIMDNTYEDRKQKAQAFNPFE